MGLRARQPRVVLPMHGRSRRCTRARALTRAGAAADTAQPAWHPGAANGATSGQHCGDAHPASSCACMHNVRPRLRGAGVSATRRANHGDALELQAWLPHMPSRCRPCVVGKAQRLMRSFVTNVACGHSAFASARQSNTERLEKRGWFAQAAVAVKDHGRAPGHEFPGHGRRKEGGVGSSTWRDMCACWHGHLRGHGRCFSTAFTNSRCILARIEGVKAPTAHAHRKTMTHFTSAHA